MNNTRFDEFYSAGINIHGHFLPMRSFLGMPFKVNGVSYPSFERISRDATRVLHPTDTSSCPSVFGHMVQIFWFLMKTGQTIGESYSTLITRLLANTRLC